MTDVRPARRLAAAVLAGLLATGLTGCAGGDSDQDGPAAAVETMLRALDAGDCDAAKDVVVTPSLIDCGYVEGLEGMFAGEGLDLDDVDFEVVEEVGADQATVEIDYHDGEQPETYEVQRVDGEWLVLFDSAA